MTNYTDNRQVLYKHRISFAVTCMAAKNHDSDISIASLGPHTFLSFFLFESELYSAHRVSFPTPRTEEAHAASFFGGPYMY